MDKLVITSFTSSLSDFAVTFYGVHHSIIDLNPFVMLLFYHHILLLWYPVEALSTLAASLFLVFAGRVFKRNMGKLAFFVALSPFFAFSYDILFLALRV